MILVDDRIGSKHYADLLGDDAVVTRLDSGDIAFDGNAGTVGIEIKKVLDAVNCLYSGRLADHQIPMMRQQYDISYLVIEGTWRSDPKSGVLQYWKEFPSQKETMCGKWIDASSGQKRLMYTAFESWLSTMEIQGGVRVRSSPSQETTASLLRSLYSWWNRPDHQSFHVMQEESGAELSRPTMLRRIIALLPRVGWDRSAILARRFKSVADIVAAPPEAWLIERQIAMGTAEKIVRAIHNED